MQASIVYSVDVIKVVRIKASAASQQSTAIKNRPKEQKVLLKKADCPSGRQIWAESGCLSGVKHKNANPCGSHSGDGVRNPARSAKWDCTQF